MNENNSTNWKVLKYPQLGGDPIYRCERYRSDMTIIDSKTYRDLRAACQRRDELNALQEYISKKKGLDNTPSSLPDISPESLWAVMETTLNKDKRFLCYRVGEKSSDGRTRAEFDGLMFSERSEASARCRELNAPLLPRTQESQYMFGETQ